MLAEFCPSIGPIGITPKTPRVEQTIAPPFIPENPLLKNISKETVTGALLTGFGVGLVLYGIHEIVNGYNDKSFTQMAFGGLLLVGGAYCIRKGLEHFKRKGNPPK